MLFDINIGWVSSLSVHGSICVPAITNSFGAPENFNFIYELIWYLVWLFPGALSVLFHHYTLNSLINIVYVYGQKSLCHIFVDIKKEEKCWARFKTVLGYQHLRVSSLTVHSCAAWIPQSKGVSNRPICMCSPHVPFLVMVCWLVHLEDPESYATSRAQAPNRALHAGQVRRCSPN